VRHGGGGGNYAQHCACDGGVRAYARLHDGCGGGDDDDGGYDESLYNNIRKSITNFRSKFIAKKQNENS
jgi:hypothetical protein